LPSSMSLKMQNAFISLTFAVTISFDKTLCFKTALPIKFYRAIIGFGFDSLFVFLLYRIYHRFAYPTFTSFWFNSDTANHDTIRMNLDSAST